jgi:hypothetical protein
MKEHNYANINQRKAVLVVLSGIGLKGKLITLNIYIRKGRKISRQ